MNVRPFEIALVAFFGIVAVVSLFMLSNYEPDSSAEAKIFGDGVEIWGTQPASAMERVLTALRDENEAYAVVRYTQIDERSFDNVLVNAIAEGRSPDLVLLPHSLLVTYRSKLQPISFEALPERTFRDTYVDGAEIFVRSDGVYGIPFAVDPLVLYWNRDLFSSAGIAQAPSTWEEIVAETTPALTRKDAINALSQSAIALGEYSNVAHAKDIVSMLFMQSGEYLVREAGTAYEIILGATQGTEQSSAEIALAFYTQFAMPQKALYTWNSTRKLDRTEFTAGTLALYIGRGSERTLIERQNANLNFDITLIPQGRGATVKRTYGEWYAFALPRASKNIQGAYAVATALGSPTNAQGLARELGFAPVHRAIISNGTQSVLESILFDSALIARGWLDPNPEASGRIFERMITDARTEAARPKTIILDAAERLESLF